METTTPIIENWSYTQLTPTRIPDGARAGQEVQEEKKWFAASKFPTSVHVELMKRGELADHCKGLNEWDIQASRGFMASGGRATYASIVCLIKSTVGWRVRLAIQNEVRDHGQASRAGKR
jgi:hypothetical protein